MGCTWYSRHCNDDVNDGRHHGRRHGWRHGDREAYICISTCVRTPAEERERELDGSDDEGNARVYSYSYLIDGYMYRGGDIHACTDGIHLLCNFKECLMCLTQKYRATYFYYFLFVVSDITDSKPDWFTMRFLILMQYLKLFYAFSIQWSMNTGALIQSCLQPYCSNAISHEQ